MNDARLLAKVESYDDLIAALRSRKVELGLSDGTLDDLAHFTNGHAGKLLSQVKNLGPVSLGAMLRALGMMMVLYEDAAETARITSRVTKRDEKAVRREGIRSAQRTARKYKLESMFLDPHYFSKLGRKGGRRYKINHTERERKEAARRAANARWKRERQKARETAE